jgi:filamentous hemagglutinin
VDSFEIVSRAAQINGQLYAKKLTLYTGANHYDYLSGKLDSLSGQAASQYSIALDVSSLGGMYANSIRLVGTEKGMGVNSQGLIQSVNDLELTVDGNIKVRDVVANQSAKVQADNLEVTGNLYAKDLQATVAQDIHNTGMIAAQDSLSLSAKKLKQEGELYSGLKSDFSLTESGSLSLAVSDTITNSGTIRAAANAAISASIFDNDKGKLIFSAQGQLEGITQLNNSGLIQFDGENASVNAAGITNSGAIALAGNGQLKIAATNEFINSGNISANNLLGIKADKLNNTQGNLIAPNLQISARTIDNTQGQISGNRIDIDGDGLSNNGGQISAYGSTDDSLNISLKHSLNNDKGVIATNSLSLALASDSISNKGGLLSLGENARLDIITQSNLNNSDGRIEAGEISIQAGDLDNNNAVIATRQASLQVRDLENNLGLIQGDFLSIFAQTYRSQGGTLLATSTAGKALDLNLVDSLENNAGAILEARSGDLVINADNIDNQGGSVTLLGGGQLQLIGNTVTNQQGKIGSEKGLSIKGGSFENGAGSLVSSDLDIEADVINNRGGNINADTLVLKNNALDNSHGRITAQEKITAHLLQLLNSDGVLLLGGSGDISVDQFDNSKGKLLNSGNGLLSVTARQLDNMDGSIQANADVNLQLKNLINHRGEVSTQTSLDLQGDQLDNSSGSISAHDLSVNSIEMTNAGGSLAAENTIQLKSTQQFNNNNGQLLAGNAINLTAPKVDNNQGVIKTNDLNISTRALTNERGYLQADQISLQVPELNNHQGVIFATGSTGSGLQLQVDKLLDNSSGTIANKGKRFSIIANEINNSSGSISYQGTGDFTVQAVRLDNQNGSLLSDINLNLSATTLDNTSGDIHVGKDLTLWLQGDLLNALGEISSTNTQKIHANHLNNKSGTLNAKNLSVVATQLDNAGVGQLETETLKLDVQQLNNEGLILASSRSDNGLVFNVRNFDNAGRLESYGRNLLLQNVNLRSTAGEIVHHGDGELHIVSEGAFDNQQGLISTQGTLAIDATEINNQSGKLLAGKKLDVQLTSLSNRGGLLQSGDGLSLHLENFDNSQGGSLILGGDSEAVVSVSNLFDNTLGSISYWGKNTLKLSAANFSNTHGSVGGVGAIGINAARLDNAGGYLGSELSLSLAAQALENNAGSINAAQLSLVLGQFENNGVINSTSNTDNSFHLTAERFSNRGVLQVGANNLVLNTAHLDNSGGTVIHSGTGTLEIGQEQLGNQGGKINSQGSMLLNINDLDNSGEGELVAAQNLTVKGASLNNTAGVIETKQAIKLSVAEINNGDQGQILALGDGDLQIQTHRIFNAGQIAVTKLLAINATEIENQGLLQAGELFSVTATTLNNQDEIHANQVVAQLDQFHNASNAVLDTGRLELTATRVANQGLIFAGDEQQASKVEVVQLDNNGQLESHNKALQITTNNFVNDSGNLLYKGAGNLILDAWLLQNHQGIISANNASITATQLDNHNGTLVGDALTLQSTQLNNQDGLVQANQSLKLAVDTMDNQQGALLAQGDVLNELNINSLNSSQGRILLSRAQINAGDIDNTNGELVADDLSVTANNLNNQSGLLVSANKTGALQLVVNNTLTNLHGLIQGDRLDTEITAKVLDNTGGQLLHLGDGQLLLHTQELRNLEAGEISAAAQLNVQVDGELINGGIIQAAESVRVTADSIHNSGR